MLNFSFYACLVLFIVMCLFLILLILIQKGRGGGLSGAFGGAGGNTAFGSKTGDVLTWATSIVFGVFLLLAIALNLISNSMDHKHRTDVANAANDLVVPTPQIPAGLQGIPPAPAAPAAAPTGEVPAAPAAPAVEAPSVPAAQPAPAPAAAPTSAPAN